MAVEESYKQIQTALEESHVNHEKNAGGNKAAGTRARKAATELKQLLTEDRKASIDASK